MAANTSTMLADHPVVAKQQGPLSDGNSSSLSELDDIPDDQPDFEVASDEDSEQDLESNKDNDTEAETERIDPSPAKVRQGLPARVEHEEDENPDDNVDAGALQQQSERESSIIAPEVEPLSPVGDAMEDADIPVVDTVDRGAAVVDGLVDLDSPRKRKRSSSLSDIDETSEVGGQPVRKRSTSKRLGASVSPAPDDGEADQDAGLADDASEASENEADAVAEDEAPEVSAPVRKRTRRTAQEEIAAATPENADDADGALNEEEEEANGQNGDQDDENTARSEEEMARKMVAMDNFKQIESKWAIFRDKLFDEKLRELAEEQEDLERDEPANLEYIQKRYCLDQRRDEKIKIEDRALFYKTQALERTTLAERSIAHSKFAQDVRDSRDQRLSELNESFIKIQRERRQSRGKESQYTHTFNPKRTQQITQQRSYNKEVSLLSGIAKYSGFPGAPELDGASAEDVENDLKRMNVRNTGALPPIPTSGLIRETQIKPRDTAYSQIANSKQADEMAGEGNFLAKNAWARNPPLPPHVLQDRPHGTQTFADLSTPKRNGVGNGQPAGSASTIAMSDPRNYAADAPAATGSPLDEMRRQYIGAGSVAPSEKETNRNALGIFEAGSERARSTPGVKSAGPTLTPHEPHANFFGGAQGDSDKHSEGAKADGDVNGNASFPMMRVQSRDRPQFGPIAGGITADPGRS